MSDIPVIDVQPLLDPNADPAAQREVAAMINRACETIGFFAVVGHGVSHETRRALEQAAYSFFDLPMEEKMLVKRPRPEQNRGYIATGEETLARLAGKETPPDIKELFAIGPFDLPETDYFTNPHAYPSFAPNRWPSSPPELAPAMKAYWRAVESLAKGIAKGFAIGLELEPNYFAPRINNNTSQLRVMHYPAPLLPPLPGQLRAGEHNDLNMMTILYSDNDVGGLQAKRRDGVWVDVPVIKDAFVINIGDMMMRWANDRWVSTPHRVINPPSNLAGQSRRLSIGYFFIPNYDTLIECLPSCRSSDQPAKYAPVTVTEYRTQRFARTAGSVPVPA